MRGGEGAVGSQELEDCREAVQTPATGAHTSASGCPSQVKEAVEGRPAPPWGPALLMSTGRDVGGGGQSCDHRQSGAPSGMLRAGTLGSIIMSQMTGGSGTAVGWRGPWL